MGRPVRIGGRALDLLAALVRKPGEVISKRVLISHAWPRVAVDDANLKVNMAALRRALGDGNHGAEYVATVTGRGYRFVERVQLGEDQQPSPPASSPTEISSNNLAIATTRILGRADAIESMRKAQELAAISWELRAANDLAALWTGQARQMEVRDLLEPLLGHFSQGHTTRDLQNAAKLLHNSSPP
jgi:DNA-binding winged helix-turn-helix (wHTH) protein